MHDRTDQALKHYGRHPYDIVRMLSRFQRSKPVDGKFLFILGPPRSGTTLLHRILLNHTQITGFSYETSIISPKPIFDTNRFNHYVTSATHKKALSETVDIPSFFQELHKLAFPDHDLNKDWFIEKTPQHSKRMHYILKYFPNSKVIFCSRDGRDTYCSGKEAGNIPQSKSPASHAKYFNKCVNPYLELSEHPRVKLSRYEDFVEAPEECLSKLMNWIGLDLESSQLNRDLLSSDIRAASKAFTRLNSTIDGSTIGRWKKEMSAPEVSLYNFHARESLRRLGYSDR